MKSSNQRVLESTRSCGLLGGTPVIDSACTNPKTSNYETKSQNTLSDPVMLQQLKYDQLGGRLRMLKHQVVQNMCISTAVNTQLALQMNLGQQFGRDSSHQIPSVHPGYAQTVIPSTFGPHYMHQPLIPHFPIERVGSMPFP